MVTWQGKEYADWTAARAAMNRPASVLVQEPEPEPEPVANEPPATIVQGMDRPITSREPSPTRQNMAAKYRPRRLADLVGQLEARAELSGFSANPFPAAFLLAGETGTGKTSAAYALAGDLGCDLDAEPAEFGGVHSIPSGEQTADALRELWPTLWHIPFTGSGWKIVILNEVERLNGAVEKLWLDKLEDMPPKTVIVFTTNDVDSLPQRFVDRCNVIVFEADALKLGPAARSLVGHIWRSETGNEPDKATVDRIAFKAEAGGKISFRRIVQAVGSVLAVYKLKTNLGDCPRAGREPAGEWNHEDCRTD